MSSPSRPTTGPRFWLIRIPALLALGIAVFLLYQKWAGNISAIVGCGGEGGGGCAQVLGGRWSQWFGVPVTALAAALYGGGLFLTVPAVWRGGGVLARRALLAVGLIALLGAGWFLGLLVFVERAFCPYCLAVHVCGIAFGIAVLVGIRPDPLGLPLAFGIAGLAVGILALGQYFGPAPATHQIAEVRPAAEAGEASGVSGASPPLPAEAPAAEVPSAPAPPPDGTASFLDGAIVFEVAESPHIGNPEAGRVIAEFFDYTCRSCRDMHGDMHGLLAAHPEAFAVVLVPCPLNVECNPNFEGDSRAHAEACDYARLALAVWRAVPGEFAEFHEYLMAGAVPPPLSEARALAEGLAGRAVLAEALDDFWISARLAEASDAYSLLVGQSTKMPKLLLGGQAVMTGVAKDRESFIRAIEEHFQMR